MQLALDVTTVGSKWTVTADLRDQAGWELFAHKQGMPLRVTLDSPDSPAVLYLMHLAWTASKRDGRTSASWNDWLQQCLAVDAQDTGQDQPDPTQQAAGPG